MRIASVPYLNALPLTRYFRGEVITAPPRDQLGLLIDHRVDAALLPVADAIQSGLYLYPECGLIGCNGAVLSVGFFTQSWIAALNQISSIYWDVESRTSVQLAKILLKKNGGNQHPQSRSQNENPDALLLIGDKALFYQGERRFWDFGDLWKQLTGYGFLFACWASSQPLNQSQIAALQNSKQEGMHHLDDIIKRLPHNQTLMQSYFKQALCYDATPAILDGFACFKRELSFF